MWEEGGSERGRQDKKETYKKAVKKQSLPYVDGSGWKQHNYYYIPCTIFSLIAGCSWVWSEHLAGSEVIAASSYKTWLHDFPHAFWCTISKKTGDRKMYFLHTWSPIRIKLSPPLPPNILSKKGGKKKPNPQMLQIHPADIWKKDIQGGRTCTPRQSACLGTERWTEAILLRT